MKKVVIALGIVVIASQGWAAEGSLEAGAQVSETINVTATVPAYASITVNPDIQFSFDTGAGGASTTTTKTVTVETNAAINVTFTASGSLSQTVGATTYTIDTAYTVSYPGGTSQEFGPDANDTNNNSGALAQGACSTANYTITGTATLGANISSQAAGDYSDSTITVTVAAQ
jgi:hypothetical protein